MKWARGVGAAPRAARMIKKVDPLSPCSLPVTSLQYVTRALFAINPDTLVNHNLSIDHTLGPLAQALVTTLLGSDTIDAFADAIDTLLC